MGKYLGVPERIITKPSSPRLWPGQTAEGELGLSYELIDQILYYRFEEWLPEEKIAEKLNVPLEIVNKLIERVKRTQHKRLMPEVFHLGFRDLNSDLRYPREWI